MDNMVFYTNVKISEKELLQIRTGWYDYKGNYHQNRGETEWNAIKNMRGIKI